MTDPIFLPKKKFKNMILIINLAKHPPIIKYQKENGSKLDKKYQEIYKMNKTRLVSDKVQNFGNVSVNTNITINGKEVKRCHIY